MVSSAPDARGQPFRPVLDAISDFLGTYLRGGWTALLDIALVAIIIYWVFILIRGTRAVRIVIGLPVMTPNSN